MAFSCLFYLFVCYFLSLTVTDDLMSVWSLSSDLQTDEFRDDTPTLPPESAPALN